MKILVSTLRSNPYRNVAHYPVDRDKIDALKESILTTTFWDNIIARPSPTMEGAYEQAYGEHRKAALLELMKENPKQAHKYRYIDIPVRDFTNTDMARIMAHENMEEWGHNASIEQETVRSIIEAYGKGEIELPKPKGNHGELRYAPFFSPRGEKVTDYPYTVLSLANFLGWKPHKVEGALGGLELIEAGVADAEDFKDLSTRQAREVAHQGKRVLEDKREADPKASARVVVRGLSAGMAKASGKGSAKKTKGKAEVTIHTARQAANRMLGRDIRQKVGGKPKGVPDIDTFAMETARTYGSAFDSSDKKMKAIIEHRQYLSDASHKVLVASLQRVIKEASKHLAALDRDGLKTVFDDMRINNTLTRITGGR